MISDSPPSAEHRHLSSINKTHSRPLITVYDISSHFVTSHSLVLAFAEEEQGSPCLHRGQDERDDSDERDETAGCLRTPLVHHEPLLPHRHILVLPHPLGEQQTFPLEVIAVFRERHDSDETKEKCQKIEDALAKQKIVKGHLYPPFIAKHECACAMPASQLETAQTALPVPL